jgi:YfiH family protein
VHPAQDRDVDGRERLHPGSVRPLPGASPRRLAPIAAVRLGYRPGCRPHPAASIARAAGGVTGFLTRGGAGSAVRVAVDRIASDCWLALPGCPSGIRGGVSTRRGGVSRDPWASLNLSLHVGDEAQCVEENLRRVSAASGVALDRAARIPLEHGTRVVTVTQPGLAPPGDALVTIRPGLPLALTVADCLPLYLAAPGRAVAVVHCGWRGLAAGIVSAALDALAEAAATPRAQWHAWVGPGIGACCYDLPWEDARHFVGLDPRAMPPPRRDAGRVPVDLVRHAIGQLRAGGLDEARVRSFGGCTACQPERFFSHRRDRGRSGRMLAWIVMENAGG